MDGRGQWRDNVFVERLWKTVRYEEIYLKAYVSVSHTRTSIGAYLDDFYNTRRPHRAHDGRTPDMVYFASLPRLKAEASAVNTGLPTAPLASGPTGAGGGAVDTPSA